MAIGLKYGQKVICIVKAYFFLEIKQIIHILGSLMCLSKV